MRLRLYTETKSGCVCFKSGEPGALATGFPRPAAARGPSDATPRPLTSEGINALCPSLTYAPGRWWHGPEWAGYCASKHNYAYLTCGSDVPNPKNGRLHTKALLYQKQYQLLYKDYVQLHRSIRDI